MVPLTHYLACGPIIAFMLSLLSLYSGALATPKPRAMTLDSVPFDGHPQRSALHNSRNATRSSLFCPWLENNGQAPALPTVRGHPTRPSSLRLSLDSFHQWLCGHTDIDLPVSSNGTSNITGYSSLNGIDAGLGLFNDSNARETVVLVAHANVQRYFLSFIPSQRNL